MPLRFSFSQPVWRNPSTRRKDTSAGRIGIVVMLSVLVISTLGSIGIILYNTDSPTLSASVPPAWDRRKGKRKPDPWTAEQIRQPIGKRPGSLIPPSDQNQTNPPEAVSPPDAEAAAPAESFLPVRIPDAPSSPGPSLQSTVMRNVTQEETAPEQEISIRHITFRPENESEGERLLIQANRFFQPVVFGLEGTNPYGEHDRIVVDITGIPAIPSDIAPVVKKGRLVRDVRHHYYGKECRLRIVLDLAPAAGYEVSQTFFTEQNLYTLSVMEVKHPPITTKNVSTSRPGKSSEPAVPASVPSALSENAGYDTSGTQGSPLLRTTPRNLTENDIRSALLKHGFYSTCGIYNAEYCNPDGNYTNRYFDCLEGALCDEATGLMWEKGGSERPLTWDEAGSYIADLNRHRVGGYGDWRLPTIEELLSLMESSWQNGGLFIDDRFEAAPRTCWSGDIRGPGKAWKANFHLGYVVDSLTEERNWVRAVRTLEPALPGSTASPKSASASEEPRGGPVMADRGRK